MLPPRLTWVIALSLLKPVPVLPCISVPGNSFNFRVLLLLTLLLLHSIPLPTLHPPLSEIEARRGFQRMMRNAMNTRAPRPIAPSEVIDLDD